MNEARIYEEEVRMRELKRRNYQREVNTQQILFMAGEYDFTVVKISDDHLQLIKGVKKLSMYPGTSKAVWHSNPAFAHLTRKGFRIKNIEKFIIEDFINDTNKPKPQAPPPETKSKAEVLGECPCGGHFVKRYNNTSKSAFLGCSNYPKCKRTKQIFINKTN